MCLSLSICLLLFLSVGRPELTLFLTRPADLQISVDRHSTLILHKVMSQLTARQKHDILVQCAARHAGESEVEIARQHGVSVGRTTIWEWRQRWNGTPQSLERREGSDGTPKLTPLEVSRHVRAPILAANRAHRAISYTKMLPEVRRKTRKDISLRTLQRTGQKQLGVRFKHRIKRTKEERQCPHAHGEGRACVLSACD